MSADLGVSAVDCNIKGTDYREEPKMTTATPTPTTITCPAWCAVHPALEPMVHQSAGWRDDGRSVVIEQDGAAPNVFVSANVTQNLDLTEAQAHELGMALVRASDMLRHARTEAQQ